MVEDAGPAGSVFQRALEKATGRPLAEVLQHRPLKDPTGAERAERDNRERARLSRLPVALLDAGLPERLIADVKTCGDSLRESQAQAASSIAAGGMHYLIGPVGSGKSVAAAAGLQWWMVGQIATMKVREDLDPEPPICRGETDFDRGSAWTTAERFVSSMLRAQGESGSSMADELDRLGEAEHLVIDDLWGLEAQRLSRWVVGAFGALLQRREESLATTVITSNYDNDGHVRHLLTRAGRRDEPIEPMVIDQVVSRLQRYEVHRIAGPDGRRSR